MYGASACAASTVASVPLDESPPPLESWPGDESIALPESPEVESTRASTPPPSSSKVAPPPPLDDDQHAPIAPTASRQASAPPTRAARKARKDMEVFSPPQDTSRRSREYQGLLVCPTLCGRKDATLPQALVVASNVTKSFQHMGRTL